MCRVLCLLTLSLSLSVSRMHTASWAMLLKNIKTERNNRKKSACIHNFLIQNQCDVCSFVFRKSHRDPSHIDKQKYHEFIRCLLITYTTFISVATQFTIHNSQSHLLSGHLSLAHLVCVIFNSTVIDYYLNWNTTGGSQRRNNSFVHVFLFCALLRRLALAFCLGRKLPEHSRGYKN